MKILQFFQVIAIYSLQNDLYFKSCNSSFFDIQYIRKNNNSLKMCPIDDINRKLIVLPCRDQRFFSTIILLIRVENYLKNFKISLLNLISSN